MSFETVASLALTYLPVTYLYQEYMPVQWTVHAAHAKNFVCRRPHCYCKQLLIN